MHSLNGQHRVAVAVANKLSRKGRILALRADLRSRVQTCVQVCGFVRSICGPPSSPFGFVLSRSRVGGNGTKPWEHLRVETAVFDRQLGTAPDVERLIRHSDWLAPGAILLGRCSTLPPLENRTMSGSGGCEEDRHPVLPISPGSLLE